MPLSPSHEGRPSTAKLEAASVELTAAQVGLTPGGADSPKHRRAQAKVLRLFEQVEAEAAAGLTV